MVNFLLIIGARSITIFHSYLNVTSLESFTLEQTLMLLNKKTTALANLVTGHKGRRGKQVLISFITAYIIQNQLLAALEP